MVEDETRKTAVATAYFSLNYLENDCEKYFQGESESRNPADELQSSSGGAPFSHHVVVFRPASPSGQFSNTICQNAVSVRTFLRHVCARTLPVCAQKINMNSRRTSQGTRVRWPASEEKLSIDSDLLSTPPWINSPLRQSVSDAVEGDCGPVTASSAPWEKQKSGNRKTWGRAGPGHAQEPEDTQNSRGSAHAVQEGGELYAFESNQQQQSPPPPPSPPPPQAGQTRTTPLPCVAAVSISNSSGTSRSSTRLEVLPPASPGACSGCFGTPPQQEGGGEVVTGGGGLRNPRPSPTRRGYSRAARSDASATASSGSGGRDSSGSGGRRAAHHDRRRIATTPVWKRPAVPLSKPYIPVPRKDSGRL